MDGGVWGGYGGYGGYGGCGGMVGIGRDGGSVRSLRSLLRGAGDGNLYARTIHNFSQLSYCWYSNCKNSTHSGRIWILETDSRLKFHEGNF